MLVDKDKRKTKRQPIRYTAWIAPRPGELHGCVLSDISETGAHLAVRNADTVPDSFMLLLARNGKARRPCRVMWRKEHQLGVAFVTHDAKAAPAAPMQADAASPPLAPAEAEPKTAPAEKV